jgi:hypothetical protein
MGRMENFVPPCGPSPPAGGRWERPHAISHRYFLGTEAVALDQIRGSVDNQIALMWTTRRASTRSLDQRGDRDHVT